MLRATYVHSDLSRQIIGSAIEVHRHLGPGLLESTYRSCLVHEMRLRGMSVETEVLVPLEYKGLIIPCGYRADLLVEGKVLVELKAVESLLPIHEAQVLTYQALCRLPLGLLMNFNARTLREGLRRLIRHTTGT